MKKYKLTGCQRIFTLSTTALITLSIGRWNVSSTKCEKNVNKQSKISNDQQTFTFERLKPLIICRTKVTFVVYHCANTVCVCVWFMLDIQCLCRIDFIKPFLHNCIAVKSGKCVNSFSESSRWLTLGLPGCGFVWVRVLSFPRGQLKGAFSSGATGGIEQGDSAIGGKKHTCQRLLGSLWQARPWPFFPRLWVHFTIVSSSWIILKHEL